MRDLFSDLPEGATTNTAGPGEKQKLDATTGRRREADQQFAGQLAGCSPALGTSAACHVLLHGHISSMSRFAALDFETANYERDSACAVALTVVSDGRIVQTISRLVRPPSRWFKFTDIHGITWDDVAQAPTFDHVWEEIRVILAGVRFIAAHNAPFDEGVLKALCDRYGLEQPRQPFVCTVSLARQQWQLYPTKLPNVCQHLQIPLKHHDAASDAEACARIVIAAQKQGWRFGS